MDSPVLRARGLSKSFGPGCAYCRESTGPETGRNVCPSCGTAWACRDVSLDLYREEVLGIVGESGSGKSTLIRLLNFDWEPSAGSLYMDGLEGVSPETDLFTLSSFGRRQVRNMGMGVVYQSPHLGLRMNISSGGNIAEKLLMAGWRHYGRMRERAQGLLDKTEVPRERMDERPSAFSGGMQQRVQIAKALSSRPAVLLLDEVTTGLDVSVQARVLDLIRGLQREFHLAILIVSHDLGVIRLLTSRTLVMRHGCIIESGLTDQVLEDPQHEYTQLLVSSAL